MIFVNDGAGGSEETLGKKVIGDFEN